MRCFEVWPLEETAVVAEGLKSAVQVLPLRGEFADRGVVKIAAVGEEVAVAGGHGAENAVQARGVGTAGRFVTGWGKEC